MNDIINSKILRSFCETADAMYRHGWNEYNGGNLSLLLTQEEAAPYIGEVKRVIPLPEPMPHMAGKFLLITATGSHFAEIMKNPSETVGLIGISEDGRRAMLFWGFSDGGRFTSEITLHLGAHYERLKISPRQRVVMHAHPANVIALTHLRGDDGAALTRELWRTCTEVIALLPDGVALIPWMVSSSVNLGLISAKCFAETPVVIWQLHGMTIAAESPENALGLYELVDKAAGICLMMDGKPELSPMTDEMLLSIVKALGVKAKTELLSVK